MRYPKPVSKFDEGGQEKEEAVDIEDLTTTGKRKTGLVSAATSSGHFCDSNSTKHAIFQAPEPFSGHRLGASRAY